MKLKTVKLLLEVVEKTKFNFYKNFHSTFDYIEHNVEKK